jgi:hypothetical protein
LLWEEELKDGVADRTLRARAHRELGGAHEVPG